MKNIEYNHFNILRKCLLMYENFEYNHVMNIHQKMNYHKKMIFHFLMKLL